MILRQNQSNFDFSTQLKGDVKAVLDFCVKNEISLTDSVSPGTEVLPFETIYENDIVSDYFEGKETILATSGIVAEEEIIGIDTMIIETNFDIS